MTLTKHQMGYNVHCGTYKFPMVMSEKEFTVQKYPCYDIQLDPPP